MKKTDPETEKSVLDRNDGPDSVGYKKPPRSTRFKKGHSGNPKGRPKGSQSLQQLIHKELAQRITVTVSGRRRTLTKREAIAITIVTSGLRSDARAIHTILQIEALAEQKGEQVNPHSPVKDNEVVEALKRRFERGLGITELTGGKDSDESDR